MIRAEHELLMPSQSRGTCVRPSRDWFEFHKLFFTSSSITM